MNDPSVSLILHIILWRGVHHKMRTFYRLEVQIYPNVNSEVHKGVKKRLPNNINTLETTEMKYSL